jgi:hypothetical protein
MSGAQNTADGLAPVVTGGGKHSAATITIRGLYTKVSGELFDYINDRWEVAGNAAKTVYLKWAPEGGIGTVVGNEQFSPPTTPAAPSPASSRAATCRTWTPAAARRRWPRSSWNVPKLRAS